jgi:hypothetical protein
MFDQMNIQFLVDDVGGVIICKEKIGCKKFNTQENCDLPPQNIHSAWSNINSPGVVIIFQSVEKINWLTAEIHPNG